MKENIVEKNTFYISRESLTKLGIDPNDVIRAIYNKKAVSIHPYHVKIVQVLNPPAVPSS